MMADRCDVAVFRPISARSDSLITNGRMTLIILQHRYTTASLHAESL